MRVIRTAQPNEADKLSDLAFRSKAYWGYSEEFMANCKKELEIKSADLVSGLTCVFDDNGLILGFYSLYGKEPEGLLTDLFVEPDYIGTGVGKKLWNAAINHASKVGYKSLEIHADPHAESFYLHMGASKAGTVPSVSIPGRDLPLLIFKLER